MPIGIISNTGAVLLGGLIGGALSDKLPGKIKNNLPSIFSFCAMAIGFPLICQADARAPVILSLIIGYIIGELLNLEGHMHDLVDSSYRKLFRGSNADEQFISSFIPIIVIFCGSGTGIFGAMNEGFTGDSSVLLAKAFLDFFTAMIFAANLNSLVAAISLPQALIYCILFFASKLIMPYITPAQINNFSAVGGVISVMSGFRIAKIKEIRITNVLPALLLIFPITALWALIV